MQAMECESAIASCNPCPKKKCKNVGALMGNRHRPVSSLALPACMQASFSTCQAATARKGKARKASGTSSHQRGRASNEAINLNSSCNTCIKTRRKKEALGRSHAHAHAHAHAHIRSARYIFIEIERTPHPVVSILLGHSPTIHFFLCHSEADVIANKAGQLQSSKANLSPPPSLSCLKAILPLFELHHPTTVNSRSSYLESTSKAPRTTLTPHKFLPSFSTPTASLFSFTPHDVFGSPRAQCPGQIAPRVESTSYYHKAL